MADLTQYSLPDPVLVYIVWGLVALLVILWLAALARGGDGNQGGGGDHRWNGRPK